MKKYLWLLPNRKNLIIWLFSIVMLLGVLVFKWRPETVLLTYLFETIVIGFIHVFKLWATYKYSTVSLTHNGKHENKDFFIIPLFILNYYFFIFIQSVFVFAFFQSLIPGIKDEFNVFQNYLIALKDPDIFIACISILFVNIVVALQNFFFPGKYREKTVKNLFMQPYLRIFIQQFVTILTGLLMIIFNTAIASAVLLILIRLIVDTALQQAAEDPVFRQIALQALTKGSTKEEIKQTENQLNNFLEN